MCGEFNKPIWTSTGVINVECFLNCTIWDYARHRVPLEIQAGTPGYAHGTVPFGCSFRGLRKILLLLHFQSCKIFGDISNEICNVKCLTSQNITCRIFVANISFRISTRIEHTEKVLKIAETYLDFRELPHKSLQIIVVTMNEWKKVITSYITFMTIFLIQKLQVF